MVDRHSRGATVLDDLPDWIVIEEILVRLPTKDVLRCRAVRTSWRSGTSTHKFILAHRRRQPSLAVICVDPSSGCSHLAVFRGTGADPRRILRFGVNRGYRYGRLELEAAVDGLLLVSCIHDPGYRPKRVYHVCNPATRQCAPLPHFPPSMRTHIAAFYRHQQSGDYHVLYWTWNYKNSANEDYEDRNFSALTLGSGKQRCIRQPPWLLSLEPQVLPVSRVNAPVLHRGCLHWQPGQDCTITGNIIVFDTTVETFRLMRCPAERGSWPWLLEMDGALALCSTTDGVHIDVSLMQDYVAEVWAFKYRINLSAVAAPLSHDALQMYPRMVMLNQREFLIQLPQRLLHCDIDGRLLGNVEGDMWVTTHFLQESMIQLPFSMMQEQDGVNMEPPYIIGL